MIKIIVSSRQKDKNQSPSGLKKKREKKALEFMWNHPDSSDGANYRPAWVMLSRESCAQSTLQRRGSNSHPRTESPLPRQVFHSLRHLWDQCITGRMCQIWKNKPHTPRHKSHREAAGFHQSEERTNIGGVSYRASSLAHSTVINFLGN